MNGFVIQENECGMDLQNYSCGLLSSKKDPEMSKPFQLKLMWNSLVFFVRTRLPIKHTTISIAIAIINVKIISPISHLPPVRIYKKGNTDLGESQDVNVSLELLSVLSGTYVPFFCRQRAAMHCHRRICTTYLVVLLECNVVVAILQNIYSYYRYPYQICKDEYCGMIVPIVSRLAHNQ